MQEILDLPLARRRPSLDSTLDSTKGHGNRSCEGCKEISVSSLSGVTNVRRHCRPICIPPVRFRHCGDHRVTPTITYLLLTNEFVVLILTDFSKAFNSVRHLEMMEKYGRLILPDHIINWLTGYFAERDHITKFQGIKSAIAYINASIIQGSGIGPSSYIVVASDLHPINRENAYTS